MNTAPVVILRRVKRSERTCDVRTFPEIRFPEESSSLTVTVASPIDDGMLVELGFSSSVESMQAQAHKSGRNLGRLRVVMVSSDWEL